MSTRLGRQATGAVTALLSMSFLLSLSLALAGASPAHADVREDEPPLEAIPRGLKDVGIDERPGAPIPKDIHLRNQDGQDVTLGSYFDAGRPVMLVLAYYHCPMLCSMVLGGLGSGLKAVAYNAGERYRVLVVSIDPTDTPAVATEKRTAQLAAYGRPVAPRGWDFLVGSEADVKRLADTVGFHYRRDPKTGQYAHAAGAFMITPDGRLSRTLSGITFPERALHLALVEASEGKLGGAWEKVLLFCYHYDALEGSYVLGAQRFMRLGGLITLLGIFGLFVWLVRSARRPPQRPAPGISPGISPIASETRV